MDISQTYSPRSTSMSSTAGTRRFQHRLNAADSPRKSTAGISHAEGPSLTQFDFSAIEAMDPSLEEGGWKVVYDRECPFELRYQESLDSAQEVGTLEAVKVKVLANHENGVTEALKVELSSENDLFFHYTHQVDEVEFRIMQEQQKLMVEFEDFARVLIRMLNNCIKEPNAHLAIMVIQEDGGGARLDFIKNMEYKFVELLVLSFERSSEELVRQHIAYRYNAVKSKLALMQSRLVDVHALVKSKNPSLLLQVKKGVAGNNNTTIQR
mmetsp:Transcript_4400/g.8323  ORF Transcript_4400/g.8323 Transcript_4400/m.8323 type:complete len:267 (+) Transcript_4400:152-952(+)